MGLGPAEPAIHPLALRGQRERALAGRFGLVMPPAERSQVGFSVVVTGHDVVDVRCDFLAALAVLIADSAAVAVSP
jgi:hypothetical protein